MAFTPTTVTINSWASPIAITSTDAISNLDEAVNAIITTDAASLTTHMNTEMAKIQSYLTSNLSTMYTEAVAAITVPIAANKDAAAASAAAALVSETNANASAISAAASAALLTTQISNLVEDTTPQLGGNLDPNGFVINGYATIASPTFTGTVTIPAGANITGFAKIDSQTFTGIPAAPTAIKSTNTTQLATTAHVKLVAADYAPLASPTFTGTVTIPAGAIITGFAQLASPTFTGTVTLPNTNFTGTVTLPAATPINIINDTTPQLGGNLDPNGNPIVGTIEKKVAMAANNIAANTGSVFTKTITAATTFTVSGKATTGNTNSFILELTNGGAYIVTWWSGVKWAGGTAPSLTASGVDVLGFYSHDGGTTWRGILLAKDSK